MTIMEKRQSKRIVIGFKVQITSGEKTCEGMIEDLSEVGVGVITVPAGNELHFSPGEMVDLKFQPHPDETLNCQCKIKWLSKDPSHGLTTRVGMEIIDPPWDKSGYFL